MLYSSVIGVYTFVVAAYVSHTYLYTGAPPQAEFSAAALFYPLTGSAGLESCRLSQRDELFRDLIRRNELIRAAGQSGTKDQESGLSFTNLSLSTVSWCHVM